LRVDLVLGADVVGLAVDPSGYRVRFWSLTIEPGFSRAIEEWRIADVNDFQDVYRWAEATAGGRDFEIFAVVEEPERISHVRICGSDGDSGSGTSLTVVFSKGS
jgi:hypothetical protein